VKPAPGDRFLFTVSGRQLQNAKAPGPSPTTNALRMMALEGLPVNDPNRD